MPYKFIPTIAMRACLTRLVWSFLVLPCLAMAAVDTATLGPQGINTTWLSTGTAPYFANGLAPASGWLEFSGTSWGTSVATFNNPQFDANGYPKYLNSGMKLRTVIYGNNANYQNRPSTWPARDADANGKIVVTWKGEADVRLTGGTFIAAESSGGSTGLLIDGRRVYLQTDAHTNSNLTVEAINSSRPLKELYAWLPDPADPQNRSLEGQFAHPTAMNRLSTGPWSWLRFMDWTHTNANPVQDWSDRRPPKHVFQNGILNPRSPAPNSRDNRNTGVAYEHVVAYCNAANKDLWINVPHLASNDFMLKLAQLILFGSDGTHPYTSPQANPVYPPLNANLRVYVEYSNEIWSSGSSFAQGDWASAQATAAGTTKAKFTARLFCNMWAIFQSVFGSSSRLIKVAPVYTNSYEHTLELLNEIKTYGTTLVPAQVPDVISPTVYFSNKIHDWVLAKAKEQASTPDPWFLTTAQFDAGGGNLRLVSVPANSSYWTGPSVQRHLAETLLEWERLVLFTAYRTGGSDLNVGGFHSWLPDMASTTFPTRIPLIAYEGGPSMYTDEIDGNDSRDDGITTFLELLNRQADIAKVYRMQLNHALAKGLRTYSAYTDVSQWGKFGQWGHLEFGAQAITESPKAKFLFDWNTEALSLRNIYDLAGLAPSFSTGAQLTAASWGKPYSTSIVTAGGDKTSTLVTLGQSLSDGLSVSVVGNTASLTGTPTKLTDSFLFLRVNDGDGDSAWRTFRIKTVGGPRVIAESNFEGTTPAKTRPWTKTYALEPGWTYSGWTKGAGITANPTGNDALVYYQRMPKLEADSTLNLAITNNQYWSLSLTPPTGGFDLRNTEVRFSILRLDYNAPRQFAVFTNIGGWTSTSAVFTTPRFTSELEEDFSFTLPDVSAYGNVTGPLEFRIYGFNGAWYTAPTSITAFKLIRPAKSYDRWVEARFTPAQQVTPRQSLPGEDPDRDGMTNLLEYALGTDPTWGTGAAIDFSSGTITRLGLPYIEVGNLLPDGRHALQALYPRRKDPASAGLTYFTEFSSDLSTWETVETSSLVVASDADHEAIQASFPDLLGNGAKPRFFRLRVIQNP